MKTKYKRLIIIGICIAWGLISATYFLFRADSSDLQHSIYSYLTIIYYFSTAVTEYIFKPLGIYTPFWYVTLIYLSIQTCVYLVFGIIISYILYSPWEKNPSKEAEPHEEAAAEGGSE